MQTYNIDFHNAECSACSKKHIDIRTEIIASSPYKPNRITKKIIFRCEDHLHCDVDEMEILAAIKELALRGRKITKNGLKVVTLRTANNPKQEKIDIKINNVHSKFAATNIERARPYANKTRTIRILKLQLFKKRFENPNESI